MTDSHALLNGLNQTQREAVTHTGSPLLILAGAGSGKTRVLTHKIAYLIRDLNVSPHQILAVTFTNKAAGEMKERVSHLLGTANHPALFSQLWIGTFHSIGLRILKQYAERVGYGSDFVVYDSHDQLEAIKACMKNIPIDANKFTPSAIAAFINRSKCTSLNAREIANQPLSYFDQECLKVYTVYETFLIKNNGMDFGDLLTKPLTLFKENPDILALYQRRFRHMFVDEYQDTNAVQYQFLKMLSTPETELSVVGDEDQSIYRFRGANIQNILSFQEDFEHASIIRLEQNYRSTQTILEAANHVVSHNAERLGKTLWTEGPKGDLIRLFEAEDDREEADFVVNAISKLSERVPLDQIAIFYRTNAQSRVFEEALRRARIPYRIFGGMNFFERKEIKDIVSYMRILINPHDSVSFRRVVSTCVDGIGKTTLDQIESVAIREQCSMMQAIRTYPHAVTSSRARTLFDRFFLLCESLAQQLTDLPPTRFVKVLLKETGYEEMVKNEGTIESKSRLENLDELVNAIAEYENRTEAPSLAQFLEHITLDTSMNKEDADTVRPLPLMTLHLCKGLEFPYVFLVGLEENLLPHARSLDFPAELEEERRLMYVGMTRAMKALTLSGARQRYAHGRQQFNLRSRFLDELPPHLLRIETKAERPNSADAFYSNTRYAWDDGSTQQWPPQKRTSPQPFPTSRRSAPSSSPIAHTPSRPRPSHTEQTQTQPNLNDLSQSHRVGALVKHPQFGRGIIQHLEGDDEALKLHILFENGQTKRLLEKYANLEPS